MISLSFPIAALPSEVTKLIAKYRAASNAFAHAN